MDGANSFPLTQEAPESHSAFKHVRMGEVTGKRDSSSEHDHRGPLLSFPASRC